MHLLESALLKIHQLKYMRIASDLPAGEFRYNKISVQIVTMLLLLKEHIENDLCSVLEISF